MSNNVSVFLPELSDENHLSVVKRKGLVEHLIRTSQQPKGQHEAYGPRQRPFIRRSKTSLDNLTVLRKKETIIKSGAYERSQIAPPKGKGNSWYLECQQYYLGGIQELRGPNFVNLSPLSEHST
jgi:hypothetical protein